MAEHAQRTSHALDGIGEHVRGLGLGCLEQGADFGQIL
jgi:hypothetical protein